MDTRLRHVPDPHGAAAFTAKSGVVHERWLADYSDLQAFHREHGHSASSFPRNLPPLTADGETPVVGEKMDIFRLPPRLGRSPA